ncbi:MAG TPA: FecR domain-containing protein [Polyangiaceae bacterium]|jgi:transmembrane sensor|nr:FecR domain-containing protein [Polyangiaceae bacterium]
MSGKDFRNLVPLITESRLSRQYAAIRERVPATPPRRPFWAGWVVAAAFAAALAVMVFRASSRPSALVDDAVVESGPAAPGAQPTSITLAEGSRVELGASTRARLTSARAKAIRIDLERGSVEIEATHVEGRTFVVGAGGYEVHVVGTHFTVRRDPGDQVAVRVDRGAVDIAAVGGAGGDTRRLAAGEQWSAPDGPTAHAPPPAIEPASSAPGALAAAPSAVEPASPPGVADRPSPAQQAAPVTGAAAAPHRDESAKGLFDEAQRARADGRPYDAARAFDRLRRSYPQDPRAPLSAFELGRLRLDALGDPRGAEEALRDAIALGPSSPFREDAESRRVEALWRMGDATGCASARAAYLARWPRGTYRRAVELGCGDR